MAFVDMARSHVKQLVRDVMGLSDVAEDCDGDLPFRRGTAVYYISVRSDGLRLRVWSPAVSGIKATVAVLREVNAANATLELARVVVRDDHVYVEGTLPVVDCVPDELSTLCLEVGRTADELGSMLAAVHGGETVFDGSEVCPECGSGD